ncbi:MAG: Ig-like domain-containing protein [Desulfurivibrionaceae bacterium]|nr:Ig-like domain-containing protein [Desulfurivibrionaceae bacterium]
MVSAFLAACGGSVEEGHTPDTTAPVFIKGDPEGTVRHVCAITAAFDDPIEASSVTPQSFIIKSDSAAEPLAASTGTWEISPSSDTIALFTPSSGVSLIGTYTVTVTTGITNTAGLNLAADHSWTFTASMPCPP